MWNVNENYEKAKKKKKKRECGKAHLTAKWNAVWHEQNCHTLTQG